MTTREVLIAARRRIENEEDWGNRGSVPPFGPGTECAATATDLDDIDWAERFGAIEALAAQISSIGHCDLAGLIIDFNESHTHAEVLALYDRTIEAS